MATAPPKDRTAAIAAAFTPKAVSLLIVGGVLMYLCYVVGYYDPATVPDEREWVDIKKRELFDWAIPQARAIIKYVQGRSARVLHICLL